MKVPAVPVEAKLAVLAVAATLFYTWVGQLVPQKEVHPPEVVEIAADVTPEQMVEIGKQIFEGKGICVTCHTIGRSGALRFPDLDGIGSRAGNRVPGLSGIEYLVQTLYEPNEFIVPGFIPGMPAANKPPVGLTDDEIKAVIAYLQSLGGQVTVRMDMNLLDGGADGGAAETPAEAVAEAAPAGAAGPAEAGPAEPTAAGALLANYGCTTCHYTDRPGELRGPSLWDAGARLEPDRLLLEIVNHRQLDDGPQSLERVPMGDIEAMVQALSGLAGEGGGGRAG